MFAIGRGFGGCFRIVVFSALSALSVFSVLAACMAFGVVIATCSAIDVSVFRVDETEGSMGISVFRVGETGGSMGISVFRVTGASVLYAVSVCRGVGVPKENSMRVFALEVSMAKLDGIAFSSLKNSLTDSHFKPPKPPIFCLNIALLVVIRE